MTQKIFIKTFGCQMNEYDSNRIFDSIQKIGFEKMYIGKDMVIKEDEFSSPSLDLVKFKTHLENRGFDTTSLSFEFNRNETFSFSDLASSEKDIYLYTKIGTPVFQAQDPSPYDPLLERDTLITGSMSEVKTSGNWK